MFRYIVLSLAFIAIKCPAAFAQEGKVRVFGTVITADGLPAESISVAVRGAGIETVTDADGKFSFEAFPGNYSLVAFSIIAHKVETAIAISGSECVLPPVAIIENRRQLDEVVVTGTRTMKRLSETPVLTTLIREREIRESGSVSALESLQDNIPGIVSSPNAMGNNLRIRGLNSRYVLFLVDGERMVSEGAGGNVNLDQIDVNGIRRIEMVNGASSALYGSNAAGSVINVITKEPVHKFEGSLSQSLESYSTWRAKADVGSALDWLCVRADGARTVSDGFGSDGGPYAARYSDYSAGVKLNCRPSKRADIGLAGRFFSHETFNPENSMNVRHSLTHNLTLGANGGIASTDSRNKVRFSVNATKYFDYYVLEKKSGERDLRNTASYISARTMDTWTPSEKLELVGGVEYNHEENFASTTLGSVPATKSLDDVNGFAQGHCKPAESFDLVVGARYTYNTQFGSSFTPKLSLMYSVAGFKFRGGVGTAFRAPSIKELYYDFDHQGMFWVFGNSELKAEKGVCSSLSAEYSAAGFNVSLTGYHNRINNKITQYDVINAAGANEKYYRNVSSSTIRGADANISYILLGELALKVGYSYCDAKDNSTGLQLESNTRHSGTCSATWNGAILKSPFSLQLAGRLHSPKLYQSIVADADGNGRTETEQSKPYSIWKATLVKPFRLNAHLFELTLKADNLFNFSDASFINPGRQFLAGLRYRFK
ncbi:MAG: TonB-dependent receptor [Prevotellaceae bacterium]|jgi:outer membrane receptor for ferrienterochelin and colicins|nr:TonB-dependent receptor [Prevotellaceae bacterium]